MEFTKLCLDNCPMGSPPGCYTRGSVGNYTLVRHIAGGRGNYTLVRHIAPSPYFKVEKADRPRSVVKKWVSWAKRGGPFHQAGCRSCRTLPHPLAKRGPRRFAREAKKCCDQSGWLASLSTPGKSWNKIGMTPMYCECARLNIGHVMLFSQKISKTTVWMFTHH